jgi:hypothetical protein
VSSVSTATAAPSIASTSRSNVASIVGHTTIGYVSSRAVRAITGAPGAGMGSASAIR